MTTITADFRKYLCIDDSIADHSAYLLGAKNGTKLRYDGLKGCTDYKKAVQIIKDGGYATSSTYVANLCSIIEKWNLTQFDVKENTAPADSVKTFPATPFTVSLESEFENKTSQAAEEGTAAHAQCEHKLKRALRIRSKRPVSSYDSDEMQEHTDAYVDFVLEQLDIAKQNCKDPLVLIEQHVDFSEYVLDGYGTADCVIVSDDKIHIIDFKYGMGVLVDAYENPQMKCYALGALAIYDSLYDIKEVSMSIFQPRRENVSTWTIRVDELKTWAEEILKPKAEMAMNGEGEYCPGEWCTFCRAAVRCRARAEEKLKLVQEEFKLPPLLTDEEIENILSVIPDLTKWANEIMA